MIRKELQLARPYCTRWVALLVCGILFVFATHATEQQSTPGQEPTVAETQESTSTSPQTLGPESEVPDDPAVRDIPAEAFMLKCTGCHTLGGGVLTGPDLKPMATWPRNNLLDAIKRMEAKVGPIAEPEQSDYADFLLDPGAATRLASERQRRAATLAASLEPASAIAGEQLFSGLRPFKNQGLPCAACHQAGGKGGNLAVSLEDAFARIGEVPLIATCENPGYPIMRAVYTLRPLTQQESVHVVKFLENVSTTPRATSRIPLHEIGLAGAVGLLGLIGFAHRNRLRGTRARLVSEAHASANRGTASRGAR